MSEKKSTQMCPFTCTDIYIYIYIYIYIEGENGDKGDRGEGGG